MSNTPGQGDGMDGGIIPLSPAIALAKASIIEAVVALLCGEKRIDFIRLLEKHKPDQSRRFKNIDIEVVSNSCDIFILQDKVVLELLKDPMAATSVVISKELSLTAGDPKKYSAFKLRIKGWWVPHRGVK
jgi:hypothetical protein